MLPNDHKGAAPEGAVAAPGRETGYARAERASLADLLSEAGPDRPTLCTGWTTHDLVAHLVTRERVPYAAPGLVVPALHGVTERAERATGQAHSFPDLVEMFRSGPPRWNPARIRRFDDATNTNEFYVHYADVDRARPGFTSREVDPAIRTRIWSALRLLARSGYRGTDAEIVAERTDTHERRVLRRGGPTVVIAGLPEELLLHAFGRRSVAQVELRGDPTAVATF
ncbi:TIGR03085 family protein [Frankia sp. AgB1.9]|uniref:TIGR03085 family metal-binding protein n=1 Tax=unclassified Frankia TaxID=2632575 RepID=UPI001933BA73|nr:MULTISPECIES: TIGR03085 family metal-binding protein [unclassified Frankia]MBL7492567.1 TIGR03085 family protein [Frankia sp. AgW1.1]MBL7548720.1 TIGR03085 family protein [Frankia sp. AgB1.9]MBL7619318.1 TIGR03085 family protein [Frankia sp. AgB1.8]